MDILTDYYSCNFQEFLENRRASLEATLILVWFKNKMGLCLSFPNDLASIPVCLSLNLAKIGGKKTESLNQMLIDGLRNHIFMQFL